MESVNPILPNSGFTSFTKIKFCKPISDSGFREIFLKLYFCAYFYQKIVPNSPQSSSSSQFLVFDHIFNLESRLKNFEPFLTFSLKYSRIFQRHVKFIFTIANSLSLLREVLSLLSRHCMTINNAKCFIIINKNIFQSG